MWKWIGEGWEGIPGIPCQDYNDEEFESICKEYDKAFPDQPGSLKRCGLWKHERKRPQVITDEDGGE